MGRTQVATRRHRRIDAGKADISAMEAFFE